METAKQDVKDFWNEASCGETLLMKGDDERQQFMNQMKERYTLEPYISGFAGFENWKNKKVLEIGVGLGADHQKFAEGGADLFGVDLTERAIEHTRNRLALFGLSSQLKTDDAEQLSFANDFFDLVYTWGVIHHSPNTPKAVAEIYRVLKPGGQCRVMIYHKYSFIGYMLWMRYAFLKGRFGTSLKTIYSKYLESPGTKAYTVAEAKDLFKQFENIKIETLLTHGDLLTSGAGQRHQGALLNIARKIYPRAIIKKLFPKHGLFMMISAQKSK
jgi:ubiquinone/menaquinone biosynthesis C-methylase UbiE